MSDGEGVRRVSSLRSIARKLLEFSQASAAEKDAERVRQMFRLTRFKILLAIASRPDEPNASIVEINAQGELYLPVEGWIPDWVHDDWPGSMRLHLNGSGFSRPADGSGLVTYCIWSNLSCDGRKGVAIVRDVSHASRDIEFLVPNALHESHLNGDWYTSTLVPRMYLPGRIRTVGTVVCAPIFVQSPRHESNRETTCIGGLKVAHPNPGHFCSAEDYVWVQECGTLIGFLYGLCRDRLRKLGQFTDWEAVNESLMYGARPHQPASTRSDSPFDVVHLCAELTKIRGDRKLEAFASDIGVSPRTLRKMLNEHTCSAATARKVQAYLKRIFELTAS